VAARAVKPWTWARVLRDTGPKSRDFICAMLILRTFMDDDGFAYPTLRTWAAASRMAVGTLRKHCKTALTEGWLGLGDNPDAGGKAWKRHAYRAAVPALIKLTEKDMELSIALIAACGKIDEIPERYASVTDALPSEAVSLHADTPSESQPPSCVTYVDTPSRQNGEAVSSHVDTPSAEARPFRQSMTTKAGPSGEAVSEVCQIAPHAVSKDPPCCVKAVSTESRNSLTGLETPPEALRSFEALEASKKVPSQATGTDMSGSNGRLRLGESTEIRIQKATQLVHTTPDISDEALSKMYSLTPDDLRQVREGIR
jgi:hypothetical protein